MQQRYERQYQQYNVVPTDHQSDEEGAVMNDEPRLSGPTASSATLASTATTSTILSLPNSTRQRTPSIRRVLRKKSINTSSCAGCPQASGDSGIQGNESPFLPQRPRICVTEIEDLTRGLSNDQYLDDDEFDNDDEGLFNYNDDFCSPSRNNCDMAQRKNCAKLLEKYKALNQLTEPEEIGIVRDRDDEFQIFRHVLLLLLLCGSMFVVSCFLNFKNPERIMT